MSVNQRKVSSGTAFFVGRALQLYIFPRAPEYLFNYKNGENGKNYVYLKKYEAMEEFAPIDTEKKTGLPKHKTAEELALLKERDYFLFGKTDNLPDNKNGADTSEKEITVCLLKYGDDGSYYCYNKRTDYNIFKAYNLKIFVKENNTESDLRIKFLDRGGSWKEIDVAKGIPFSEINNEYYMVRAKVVAENNSGEPVSYETLQIRAEVVDQNYEGKSIVAGCDLPLVYSTYKGWTLTEDGELMQGRTGWLFDEKGYYILKDGRRVDEGIMLANKYKEQDLKIGNENPVEGWKAILGITGTSTLRITLKYDVTALLYFWGHCMTEVVYQAFLTNRGYELLTRATIDKPAVWENHEWSPLFKPLPLPFGNYSFGVIGRDETGIDLPPITRPEL